MKILIGMHGQLGDQFIALPFIEYLKELYPDAKITKMIHKKYQGVIPILKACPYIDGFYLSDEYENFPGVRDEIFLNENHFDMILAAMPKHKSDQWFMKRHQTAEVFDMFDYKSPEEKYQINLYSPPTAQDDFIVFAPFAGSYNPNNDKKLSVERAQDIVTACIGSGYENILQIGSFDEPTLKGASQMNLSYRDSFLAIKRSKLFIHTDTGLGWAASGIQHPCLGLYSDAMYWTHIKNIQPVNPNACYLNAPNVNNIGLETILAQVDKVLS